MTSWKKGEHYLRLQKTNEWKNLFKKPESLIAFPALESHVILMSSPFLQVIFDFDIAETRLFENFDRFFLVVFSFSVEEKGNRWIVEKQKLENSRRDKKQKKLTKKWSQTKSVKKSKLQGCQTHSMNNFKLDQKSLKILYDWFRKERSNLFASLTKLYMYTLDYYKIELESSKIC